MSVESCWRALLSDLLHAPSAQRAAKAASALMRRVYTIMVDPPTRELPRRTTRRVKRCLVWVGPRSRKIAGLGGALV